MATILRLGVLSLVAMILIGSILSVNAATSVLFSDGFESGNLNAWTNNVVAGGCSFAPSTAMKHAGSYSGRAVVDGNSVSDYAVVRKTLSSFSSISTLAYFSLSVLPPSGKATTLIAYTVNYDEHESVFIKNSGGTYYLGVVRYVSGSASRQVVVVPVSLSANVWFGVEFALVVSGSAGSERVYFNGVEQSGLTRVNVDNDGGGADNCVSVGVNGWDTNVMGQGGVNWAFSMYVDDVVVSTVSAPPVNGAPTYSNVGYSSSVAGSSSVFSCLWSDSSGLSIFIFSTDNSGVWVNDTAVGFGSTSAWANVSKVLNGAVGAVVRYRWYASDSGNVWASTPIQTLTTTASGSGNSAPTYSNVGYSSSVAGSSSVFSCLWSDSSGLSIFIFSTDNSGVWVNDTAVGFGSTSAWANVSKVLNGAVGAVVRYRWYASDSGNVWASTPIQTLTTTASGSGNSAPTYSNVGYSSSVAGSSSVFSCLWSDSSGLSIFIFSTDNSGVWVNDTAVGFGSTSAWANVSKVLNGAVGAVVRYRWYASDSGNVWASTPIQTLTTTASASVTVFSSDFETGNLGQWTGTSYGGGGSAPLIQGTIVHDGGYALAATAPAGSYVWSVAYKDLSSSYNVLYLRSYVRFSATPSLNQFINIYPMIAGSSSVPLAYMHLYNDGGTLKWRLGYRTNSVAESFTLSATPAVQANQWYYIEIMYKLGSGNGEVKAWIAPSGSSIVEGSPTISVTGLTNNAYSIRHLQVGVYRPNSLALSVYHDCVVAANKYIGVESSQPGNSAPTYSNVGYSSSVAGSSSVFSCLWSDSSGLSQFIFSTDNSGVWVNDTAVGFGSTSAWANVSKVLNGAVGAVVRYRWYASDSGNVWASTPIQTLTTTASGSGSSVLFSDGFESGNLNAWTNNVVAGGCSFAPSTAMKHAGSYSGRAVVDGNSVSDYAVVRKTLSSFSSISTLAYFSLSVLPPSGKATTLIGYTVNYDDHESVFIKNSGGTYYLGVVRYVSGSASRQVVVVPVSLSANVWFGVEFALVVSGSAGSERVYFNGVEQSGLTRVNVDNDGGGADNCVSVGVNGWDTNVMGQGGVNWAFSMYVDDVRVTITSSDSGVLTIMPLGDSITLGYPGTDGYRRDLYWDLVNSGLNVDFVGSQKNGAGFDNDHEGHNGWTAEMIRDQVYGWLDNNPADVVLLHIGTNDIEMGQSATGVVAEVSSILNNIDQWKSDNQASVTVVLALIILRSDNVNWNQTTIAYNNALNSMALSRIAAGDDIIIVNMANALLYPADLSAELLHPSPLGYEKMSGVWYNALVNIR